MKVFHDIETLFRNYYLLYLGNALLEIYKLYQSLLILSIFESPDDELIKNEKWISIYFYMD